MFLLSFGPGFHTALCATSWPSWSRGHRGHLTRRGTLQRLGPTGKWSSSRSWCTRRGSAMVLVCSALVSCLYAQSILSWRLASPGGSCLALASFSCASGTSLRMPCRSWWCRLLRRLAVCRSLMKLTEGAEGASCVRQKPLEAPSQKGCRRRPAPGEPLVASLLPVAMPFAPSRVLAPSSKARSP